MKTKTFISSLALAAVAAAAFTTLPAFAKDRGNGQMGGQGERPSFETLDADGDGSLTIAEIKAQSEAKFAERDMNGDGVLSLEELSEAANARVMERIARMIEWRDQDGDGALNPAEVGGNDMGQRMFGRLDANKDGMISAEEYAAMHERGEGHGGKSGKRQGGHRNGG